MADGDPRILRASLNRAYINWHAVLPYRLTVQEVVDGVERAYSLFYEINNFLVGKGLDRLEDLLLGNALSGMLSEVLVKSLSDCAKTLVRNEKIGGHPDLIPRGKYPGDSVLHGTEGIELKSSKQHGGWQGHNPEDADLIVFRYVLGDDDQKREERTPITFVQILAAHIKSEEWSFSGRKGASRRTITASITEAGVHKLRSNPVYQDPAFVVGRGDRVAAYRTLNERFSRRSGG